MFITCTDEDFDTASMIVDTLLPHSLHLSTIYNQINRKDIVAMSYWKWYQFVLDSMPASFTCNQFLIAANEVGKSRAQAYRSLKQLINSRLCMRDVNGLYKKTQGVRKWDKHETQPRLYYWYSTLYSLSHKWDNMRHVRHCYCLFLKQVLLFPEAVAAFFWSSSSFSLKQ